MVMMVPMPPSRGEDRGLTRSRRVGFHDLRGRAGRCDQNAEHSECKNERKQVT
jgi:hypothetical protein